MSPPDHCHGQSVRRHSSTGLWSVSLMSLAMILATRPGWLERPLGGMDRVYRLHKWSGIPTVGFAALHWLVEMSDDLLQGNGRTRRPHPKGRLWRLRTGTRSWRDLGEWAIYVLLGLLVLTLWKRFSLSDVAAAASSHACALSVARIPRSGARTGGLLGQTRRTADGHVAGRWHRGRRVVTTGRIGRGRQVNGRVLSVDDTNHDIVEVRCRLDEEWQGHRPGSLPS